MIRPIGDKVLLMFPQERREEGGIIVVGKSSTRMDAVVVAVGTRAPDWIKVGSTVVADRTAGVNIRVDSVTYTIVTPAAVVAEEDLT